MSAHTSPRPETTYGGAPPSLVAAPAATTRDTVTWIAAFDFRGGARRAHA